MRLDLAFDELLPHPVDRVWRALTEADSISEWLMATDGFEPEIGSRFRMKKPERSGAEWVYAEVLELEPPHRMVWAWSTAEGSPPTIVTFELTAEAGATRLKLTHVGEIDPVTGGRLTGGWPGRLEELRRSLG